MMRNALEAYVKTLDPALQDIFRAADRFVAQAEDTLTDDFQIAADLFDVFENAAELAKRYRPDTWLEKK